MADPRAEMLSRMADYLSNLENEIATNQRPELTKTKQLSLFQGVLDRVYDVEKYLLSLEQENDFMREEVNTLKDQLRARDNEVEALSNGGYFWK